MSDFKAKYTKFAPEHTVQAYSAPPDPLAEFKGPTSKGERKGEGREGKRKGRDLPDQFQTASFLPAVRTVTHPSEQGVLTTNYQWL